MKATSNLKLSKNKNLNMRTLFEVLFHILTITSPISKHLIYKIFTQE